VTTRLRWLPDPHDQRDERGAVAPMTALLLVVVIAFTAFAVDLGLQRAAARDMQAVADAVALDTARSLPTCDATALQSAANQSLARQGQTIGQDSPLVVTPGHISPTTRQFVAGSNAGTCTAVRIQAATTVQFAFAPVIGTDSGTAVRSAVGTTDEPALCFSAGTKAIVLNSSESAIGPVLDQILRVNLGVASYTGLVDLKTLQIPLADLDAALRVGTGHGLVDDANVSLRSFLIASASVLEQHGQAARAVVLRSIAASVGTVTVNAARFLALGTGGASGLTATVNALDLVGTAIVSAAVDASNGKNAVNVSNLGIAVANLSLADAKVTIIEPPVIACGKVGVQARTAQVRLDLKTGVSTPLVSLAEISLGVRVASGTATFSGVNCSATNPTATITGTTSAANVVGYGGSGAARLDILTLGLLGVRLGLGLTGTVGSGASSYTFTYPPVNPAPGLPAMHTFGSAVNLDLQITPDSLLGLGTLLGLVVNPVLAVVNTAVGSLLTQVLGLLGIKLGTMDVTMLGRPSCSGVKLAG